MALSQAEADLARVQAEVRRLEAQLADAKERAVKLAHYIEMSKLYASGASVVRDTGRGTGGKSAMAARMTVDILRERGTPMPTRDLLVELERHGLIIDTQNPITNLSSALSRSDELVADRSVGWKLAEWETPHTDQHEPDDDAADIDLSDLI